MGSGCSIRSNQSFRQRRRSGCLVRWLGNREWAACRATARLGIRSVAANSNGSALFVNVHVGGIPRSLDGGRTWHPTIEINTDVHEVRAHPADPALIAAASAVGLCISRDAGETWTIETQGLHAPHCSAVVFSGDDILISASMDPFAVQGRIYRRPIRPDGNIAAVENGLPKWTNGKVDTGCIAAKGSTIAVVDSVGTLYVSMEFGRDWLRSNCKLPTPSSVLICCPNRIVEFAPSSDLRAHGSNPCFIQIFDGPRIKSLESYLRQGYGSTSAELWVLSQGSVGGGGEGSS